MAKVVRLCALLICFVTFAVRCSPRLYDYSDMLLVARCQSKCAANGGYPAKYSCLKECEESSWTKPGDCLSQYDGPDPCMKTCDFDSQCPGTEKCCPGACGHICQAADVPASSPDLPPIPTNVSLQERNNHTMFLVRWQGTHAFPHTFYVVQERHHIGVTFNQGKMGAWSTGFVVGKPRLKKKYVFVPGRWYQVRVAAVNAWGTRGYSPPSEPFTLSRSPSPPGVPLNLEFEAVNMVGGKYWVELHWDPPESDLPLTKYIVFWSSFVESEAISSTNNDYEVITQHEVVAPDQTHFSVPDLDPKDALIFIRVQALSVFGTKRLKSEMAQKFFNTTIYANVDTLVLPSVSTSKRKKRLGQKKTLPDFRVDKMYTQHQELYAKLSWSGVGDNITDHYTVAWSTNHCGNTSRSEFRASTDNHWYIIHGLKYNCKYKSSVKTHHHRVLYSSSISFTTPECVPGHPCSKVFTSTVS